MPSFSVGTTLDSIISFFICLDQRCFPIDSPHKFITISNDFKISADKLLHSNILNLPLKTLSAFLGPRKYGDFMFFIF